MTISFLYISVYVYINIYITIYKFQKSYADGHLQYQIEHSGIGRDRIYIKYLVKVCMHLIGRMKLELGLLKLTDLANSDQLLFWGKIMTTGQPYYLAVGVDFKDHYAFPHKKFYWSSSNM